MTLQITNDSLDRVLYDKQPQVQSQSRTSSVKASPAKTDTRGKMDTESQMK